MFLTIRGSSAGQSVARSEGLYLIPPESDSRTEVSFCWRCLAVPCELCTSRNCSPRVFLLLLLQNHSKYAFFYFVNYAFKFCLAGFGVFPASLIWSLLYFVLCDRLPRSFSKASSFNPTKSLFDKQCITVKYFEVMKMELQRKIAFVLGESIVSCFRVLSCLTIELRWSIF